MSKTDIRENPTNLEAVNRQGNKRVCFADIARGLGVIYFMWCHSVNIHVAYCDTWAMPVFFLVMGLFFKPTMTWREMIVKKLNTILVPFFLLSIPSYIQCAVTLPFKDFALKFINPFTCVHGVGWFLLCIFWCYIIYYGVVRLTKYNRVCTIAVCIILSVISFYASTYRVMGHRIVLPMYISTSLTVLPFIFIGDFLRNLIKKERKPLSNIGIFSLSSICVWGGVILFGFTEGAYLDNWYNGQSYFVFMTLSLLGVISILFACKFLPSFMGFAGEHSLLILMVHPYIIRILRLFDIHPILLFSITLVVTLLVVMLVSRYLPILEGKKKVLK